VDKVLGGLIAAVVVVLALVLMYRGWRARARRDADIVVAKHDLGAMVRELSVFYVATTEAENHLERVALRGFAHRGYATLGIYQAGIAIVLPAEATLTIPAASIRQVSVTTHVIDKVVEKDGLVSLVWSASTASGVVRELATHVRFVQLADRAAFFETYEQTFSHTSTTKEHK